MGDMIRDFFTKPLHGSLFQKFHILILNVTNDDFPKYRSIMEEYDATSKPEASHECVEDNVQNDREKENIHVSVKRTDVWGEALGAAGGALRATT
jgi:hypothetical protein